LPGLALNSDSLDLCLLRRQDYRYEPPALGFVCALSMLLAESEVYEIEGSV
jgi:hypothetical protein